LPKHFGEQRQIDWVKRRPIGIEKRTACKEIIRIADVLCYFLVTKPIYARTMVKCEHIYDVGHS